jgi:hypothetical protein
MRVLLGKMFDSHLGTGDQQVANENAQGPLGVGGLMAKFARFVVSLCFMRFWAYKLK